MADVMLVYPYRYTGAPHASPFHPLGISQLAALLKDEGIDTAVLDCTFLDSETISGRIRASGARIVGIYAMMTMREGALEIAGEVRRLLPCALLAFGGPLPTLRPRQFLEHSDVVFRGEAVVSFPRFCRDFLAGRIRLRANGPRRSRTERYPGLFTKDGAREVAPPPVHSAARHLDGLPLPDRSGYDHRRYQDFWRDREGWAPSLLMTSYGCPHGCEFCSRPVFGRRFRRRTAARVIEEMGQVRALGYDGLRISDDSFLLNRRHAEGICRMMISERLDLSWTCLARVDQIDGEEVRLMKRAGCRKVYFGLESGDDAVLRLMGKRSTVGQAERAVRAFAREGVGTAGYFMVGYPGETMETVERTFAWALSLPLDEISFTIPYPLPGTPLYRRVSGVAEKEDWSYENENHFVYASSFDEALLRRRIAETMEAFGGRRKAVHA